MARERRGGRQRRGRDGGGGRGRWRVEGPRRGGGEEDGRGVVGDGEGRVALREAGERGGRDAEGAEVVGVRGGELLARGDGVLDVPPPLLAAAHRVLLLHLGRRAPHR